MIANVIELDEQRKRRRYIALAHASDDWPTVKASFAIEGMVLDDNNADVVGRMIAGEMTLKGARMAILRSLNVGEPM